MSKNCTCSERLHGPYEVTASGPRLLAGQPESQKSGCSGFVSAIAAFEGIWPRIEARLSELSAAERIIEIR